MQFTQETSRWVDRRASSKIIVSGSVVWRDTRRVRPAWTYSVCRKAFRDRPSSAGSGDSIRVSPKRCRRMSAEAEQNGSTDALFLPISLKKSRIEIELPNGGVVRLPADVSRGVLVAVVRVVGSLRPWKAPQS